MSELKMQSHLDKRCAHILVAPFPLQGHAAPLIKLSHKLANLGVKITLMVTEFMASGVASSIQSGVDQIQMVSFPDGLKSDDDRKDNGKLSPILRGSLATHLEDFLGKANNSGNLEEEVTGVIFDTALASLLDIPKKMGIKTAIFWCSTPGCMALYCSIPKLVEYKLH